MEREQERLLNRDQEKTKEKASSRKEHVWRVINIIACFVVACTNAFVYVFANISPYMTSYLRNVTHGEVGYTDTLWVEQSSTITACATMGLMGLLALRIPTKLFLLLGMIFNTMFLIGTYWTVKISLWATILTYGLFGGLSRAILYPIAVKIGALWATPGRKGFVTGIILMGFGVGPLAWNPLTTWYVNPDNLEPDLQVGEDRYYTQSAVLDKVPKMFLLGGVLLGAIQLPCLFVIRNPPLRETTISVVSSSNAIDTGPVSQHSEPRLKQSGEAADTAIQGNDAGQKEAGKISRGTVDAGDDAEDYTWKQVLKSRAFWTLWLMIVLCGFALSFVIPLYKAYGQTFITDDHFLAVVATLSSVFNAVGRPFWGLLADRFGSRMILLTAQSLLAILVVTFLSAEDIGKVAFLLWVCAIFLCICGYYTMVPVLTLSLFGSRNFNVNTGLVATGGIFGAMIPTVIAPTVKSAFGWDGLFFVGFAGMFLGVFLNLSLEWCRCGDSIPENLLPKLSIRKRRS